jgi:hypothetical protein
MGLKFDPCSTANGFGEVSGSSNPAACADFSSYPSLDAGLQEQLGLRLQSASSELTGLLALAYPG